MDYVRDFMTFVPVGILSIFLGFVLLVLIFHFASKKTPKQTNGVKNGLAIDKDNYYIFKGFIPSDVGDNRTSAWSHPPFLQLLGIETFIWCDGQGATVLNDFKIDKNITFVRAPKCATFIKKTEANSFLDSTDRSFEMMGFEKEA